MAAVRLTKDGVNFFEFDAEWKEFCLRDGWREATPPAPALVNVPVLLPSDSLVDGAIAPQTFVGGSEDRLS